jgi:hypothetical protein
MRQEGEGQEKEEKNQVLWLMSVILDTLEAEIGRIVVSVQQIDGETPSLK